MVISPFLPSTEAQHLVRDGHSFLEFSSKYPTDACKVKNGKWIKQIREIRETGAEDDRQL